MENLPVTSPVTIRLRLEELGLLTVPFLERVDGVRPLAALLKLSFISVFPIAAS